MALISIDAPLRTAVPRNTLWILTAASRSCCDGKAEMSCRAVGGGRGGPDDAVVWRGLA